MEIITAMFLCILRIIGLFLECLLYLGISGVVLFVVGIAGIYYNQYKYRQVQKAEAADTTEDDFEESYVPVPGKRLITSTESERMWRELDRLNDHAIIENTKDL